MLSIRQINGVDRESGSERERGSNDFRWMRAADKREIEARAT